MIDEKIEPTARRFGAVRRHTIPLIQGMELLETSLVKKEERIADLEAALQPFAEFARRNDGNSNAASSGLPDSAQISEGITLGDARAARASLESGAVSERTPKTATNTEAVDLLIQQNDRLKRRINELEGAMLALYGLMIHMETMYSAGWEDIDEYVSGMEKARAVLEKPTEGR